MSHEIPHAARWLLNEDGVVLDDLGPEVFAELGRVTWAAVHLEHCVNAMCSFIRPANPREDKRGIGQKIKDALQVLHSMPAAHDRTDAAAWLVRARDAIERRNAILHAMPITRFGPGEDQRAFLGERPRGSTPYAARPLTVEALTEVREVLVEPLQDWRAVLVALDYETIYDHFYAGRNPPV